MMPRLSITLPGGLHEALEEFSGDLGLSKSKMVEQALMDYFSKKFPPDPDFFVPWS